jgi:hypothetical protein
LSWGKRVWNPSVAQSVLHCAVPRAISSRKSRSAHHNAQEAAIYCAQSSNFRGTLLTMPSNAVETATVSPADFQSLEEKVLRTIELLKVARDAKATAERAAARLREQLTEREEEFDAVRAELVALRKEREEVRTRVEKMLGQIESMTADESA